MNLREAKKKNSLETFIKEHESLEAEKEAVERYINASAIPLDNRKASPSKSDAARFSDCK